MRIFLLVVFTLLLTGSCSNSEQRLKETSPDGKLVLHFSLDDKGVPHYELLYNDQNVILPSELGFELDHREPLKAGFIIQDIEHSRFSEKWEMPWGEKRLVDNTWQQMKVDLKQEANGVLLSIVFRVFDDGLGFRYEFPEQEGIDELIILDELTRFRLAGNHTCWWIPGDWDIYEHLYSTTLFSEIDATTHRDNPNLGQTYIPYNAVNTPVTMRTESGLHLSFHEADLTDYAGMTLLVDTVNRQMTSELVGSDRLGYKVKRSLPFNTPWRTIQVSEDAAGLITSDLIENLNEPNKLGDISWFKPMKYMGIWWEMHLGKSTWDISKTQAAGDAAALPGANISSHGATTENAKAFIDFASEHNIGGLLVEGWNTGWEHWIGFEDREGVFDFVTPYPDYDLEEVVRYGKEKGVEIIMHHETSAAPRTYEAQLDTAFALMQKLGIHAVKTGYVGKIIPKGEYHHGQWMVNHYQKVIETAAKYQVAVNAHEPIKGTGKRRTWPNIISREGLRGQEFNAWASDGGNPPEHLPIVAFTRMLAGPIDFTPGIFNLKLEPYKPDNQVSTTLAKQLALYVIIDSPVQMAADLIDAYQGHPAFKFISEVGVNWEQTLVLNGEVGDYVTMVREERETGNWFLGSITDEKARNFELSLDFLKPGQSYKAIIYADAPDAYWDKNPGAYTIEEKTVTSSDVLKLNLAEGGGAAVSLMK